MQLLALPPGVVLLFSTLIDHLTEFKLHHILRKCCSGGGGGGGGGGTSSGTNVNDGKPYRGWSSPLA